MLNFNSHKIGCARAIRRGQICPLNRERTSARDRSLAHHGSQCRSDVKQPVRKPLRCREPSPIRDCTNPILGSAGSYFFHRTSVDLVQIDISARAVWRPNFALNRSEVGSSRRLALLPLCRGLQLINAACLKEQRDRRKVDRTGWSNHFPSDHLVGCREPLLRARAINAGNVRQPAS
jgi:hypothetical protein